MYRFVTVALWAVLATVGPVRAFETVVTGGWTVGTNFDFQPPACDAKAVFDTGERLVIGLDPSSRTVFAALHVVGLEGVGEDTVHTLDIAFGSESPWRFEALGALGAEGVPYVFARTDDPLFLEEFATGPDVALALDGEPLARLALGEPALALEALLRCQEAVLDPEAPA